MPAVKVAPADFHRVESWLTTHVLVERDLEMRILIRALLAGVNVHQLGPPGVAKSLGLNQFSKCISGARYFEKVLHAQMPADAVIGPYDMPKFAKTGEFERNTASYAPGAHMVFLDEVTRANGPTMDSILPMMNTEERRAEHNGGMMDTEIMLVVTASNYMPDPDDSARGALVDRFTIMQMIEDVRADDSFKEIFRRHHLRRVAEHAGTFEATRESITLEQVQLAQQMVREITLSEEFLEAAGQLRRAAIAVGLNASPRRWMELGRMCRANAFMAGRDATIPEDLAIVEHGLWRDPDDIPEAHKLVLAFHGRFEQEATEKRQEAKAAFEKLDEIRAQVEGTPPENELEQNVLTAAISASRMIDSVKARVDGVLKEAEKEKRDAANLRALANELLAAQQWFADNNLPGALSSQRGK